MKLETKNPMLVEIAAAPEITAKLCGELEALDTLGDYAAAAQEIQGPKGSNLRKQFIDVCVYHLKTSGLEHLPAAKSDAPLLSEIETKGGIRLLR